MKSKLFLFLLFVIAAGISHSQTVTLNNGFSASHITNNKFDALKTNISSYYGSFGVQYLNKQWFCLSSEIGYLRLGGKEINENLSGADSIITERFNYVHLNTTFRLKSAKKGSGVFLGAGPCVNILVNPTSFKSNIYAGYKPEKANIGGKIEAGTTVTVNRIVIGLTAIYLINLSPLAKSDFTSFGYQGFIGCLSFGYKW